MIKNIIFVVVAWVIGFAVAIYVFGGSDLTRYSALASDAVKGAATITATDCNNHSTVRYKYTVGGKSYDSSESSGDICGLMKTGDDVAIYYVAAKPEISGLREPGSTFRSVVISTILVSIVFPALVILALKYNSWFGGGSSAAEDRT